MYGLILAILLFFVVSGWIAFNIHSTENENRRAQKHRKRNDGAFDINNLPPDITTEQKDFLRKVAEFTGSNYVTPYNIQVFLADSTAKDFAKIPGWERWTANYHLMAGQEDRQRRALYSKTMCLISLDEITGNARVHGESGQNYDLDGNGCTCKDFHFRKLPCKHMYFVMFELNKNDK